jgi:hypothetical protein
MIAYSSMQNLQQYDTILLHKQTWGKHVKQKHLSSNLAVPKE